MPNVLLAKKAHAECELAAVTVMELLWPLASALSCLLCVLFDAGTAEPETS